MSSVSVQIITESHTATSYHAVPTKLVLLSLKTGKMKIITIFSIEPQKNCHKVQYKITPIIIITGFGGKEVFIEIQRSDPNCLCSRMINRH